MASSLILLLLCILNPALVLVINAVSFNESCTSGAPSCQAILAYRVMDSSPMSLGNISALFSVDASDILAANGFSPDADLSSQLSNETVRVILPCPCVRGLRTGLGVINYTVMKDDGLYVISQKFGGFVNFTEIAEANGVSNPDQIEVGQNLTIPYPCSCLENKFNDRNVLFMSYVVQGGESPAALSRQYGISLSQFQSLNPDPDALVIRLPVQSCKASFNKDAEDGDLIVPGGGYAATANGCVQCSCINAQMYCTKSPSAPSACAVKCRSSSLEIGNFSTLEQGGRCIVDSCLYDGYSSNGTIFTRIQKNTTEAADCEGVGAPPTFAYAPEEQGVPEAIAPTTGGLTPLPQPNTPSVPTSNLAPPPESGSTRSHVNTFMLLLTMTVMFFF